MFMDKLSFFKSYIAIIDQGNLKNAADYLNITPSAVSKHLSKLERYYAADLVIRDAKNIRITAEGKIFYKKCKSVLTSLIDAEEQFMNSSQQSNSTLRITLPQVLSQGKFMDMLNSFSHNYPHVKLDIIVSNKNLDLLLLDIDFAFRGGKLTDSQMRSVKLFQASTLLCAPPNYSQQVPPERLLALINEKLLIPSYVNLSTLRLYLQKIGINKELSQFSAIDDAFSYKNAVLSGMGIGIFLDIFVERELKQGLLWHILEPHDFGYKSINFNMIYHKNIKLAKAQQLFKNFVSKYFDKNKWSTSNEHQSNE